ncbi:type II secretion system (T2SS), E, N-terminal domain protein, partial [Vibrio parahaemolyticus VP-48]
LYAKAHPISTLNLMKRCTEFVYVAMAF